MPISLITSYNGNTRMELDVVKLDRSSYANKQLVMVR